jgi:hypothetical protein
MTTHSAAHLARSREKIKRAWLSHQVSEPLHYQLRVEVLG